MTGAPAPSDRPLIEAAGLRPQDVQIVLLNSLKQPVSGDQKQFDIVRGDADGVLVAFQPNAAQRAFYSRMWYCNHVLKARKLGFSMLARWPGELSQPCMTASAVAIGALYPVQWGSFTVGADKPIDGAAASCVSRRVP